MSSYTFKFIHLSHAFKAFFFIEGIKLLTPGIKYYIFDCLDQCFSTGCIVHPRMYHYNRVYWGVQHTIKQNSEFIFIPDVTVSL